MYSEFPGLSWVIYVPHNMTPTAPILHLYIRSEIGVSQESRLNLGLVLRSEGIGGTFYFTGNFQVFYSFD